jgi:hypothetical protein
VICLPEAVLRSFLLIVLAAASVASTEEALPQETPPELSRWLSPQNWIRDTDGPVVSLGARGEFDDTHIFAPCVAHENDQFRMWFCGSTGRVADRVFYVGLASSKDGRKFTRHADNPVMRFGKGSKSVLTPTMLRSVDGSVLRVNGQLRMYFSSTDFPSGNGLHTLHVTTSSDGVRWSKPTMSLLENVYAPTILQDGDEYRMWFTDVGGPTWVMRMATSLDGLEWTQRSKPVLTLTQKWERSRLFYPCVLKADDVYLMWYGSYWSAQPNKTAIGIAASLDGIIWHKSEHNPVLKPDPARPWESHYTTSQSVIRAKDGSFRIWYASRKKPPFVNKYFAINTAKWSGPDAEKSQKK